MSILQKIFSSESLASATLFIGPAGSFKKEELRQAIQILFCEKKQACGSCPGCHLFLAGNHPDHLEVESQKGAIKIDSIRELIRQVSFKPMQGSRRTILIPDADQMTEGAANALLKTLEEPPSHAIFLLTSSMPERLPATIRSRCHKVYRSGGVEEIQKDWEEILPIWREGIFPFLSRGNLNFAQSSLLAENSLREFEEPVEFLNFLEVWWRDLAVYQATRDATRCLAARGAELDELVGRRPPDRLFADLGLILETKRAVEGNVLKPLALERLFYTLGRA